MKFLFDYFPILCFFIVYKIYGIYPATAATMVASLLQITFFWFKNKRFETVHLITLVLVLLLGGSTLLFHETIFIKWKPSIVYWLFSLLLMGAQLLGKRPLLKRMLGGKITLPDPIWRKLDLMWALFFLFLGGLNLYVVYHFTTNGWVNFKLFGTLGLTILFVIGQGIYMSRYMISPKEDKPETSADHPTQQSGPQQKNAQQGNAQQREPHHSGSKRGD